MPKLTGSYPSLTVDTTATRVVSQAGAVLLVATAGKAGLDRQLSAALAGRGPRPMTPTGKPGRGRGSPTSPACLTWQYGRRACG